MGFEKMDYFDRSGTTTDAWVTVETIERCRSISSLCKNMGDTNDLEWRIRSVYCVGGIENVTTAGDIEVLSPSSTGYKMLCSPHFLLYIDVRSKLAGQATTYAIQSTITRI